jgi:hypothetical protein
VSFLNNYFIAGLTLFMLVVKQRTFDEVILRIGRCYTYLMLIRISLESEATSGREPEAYVTGYVEDVPLSRD